MENKTRFRVIFLSNGKVYEMYAGGVASAGIYGFVEVSDLMLERDDRLVVDPSEEALKREFEGVKRIYIPFHSVIRIDEIVGDEKGKPRVIPLSERQGTVFPFLIDGKDVPKNK